MMITNACQLYKDDCFNVFKNIENKSIDLILTDPPYNLAKYSTGNMKFQWRKTINNNIAKWDEEEFNPFETTDDFVRIIRDTGNIFIFTSYNLIGKWHGCLDHIFDTFQFMVWHKTNPIPNIRKSSFLNSCELICCAWNKGHTWNFKSQREMHNFYESPICMGNERLKDPKHPTQKPVKLLEHIIEISTNEGDVVFDPFMGVGSTGVAAINKNRKFIGVEIDDNYFSAANMRIQKAIKENYKEIVVG